MQLPEVCSQLPAMQAHPSGASEETGTATEPAGQQEAKLRNKWREKRRKKKKEKGSRGGFIF